MGTRKKGSELVFNLQWRNKPDNGGDKSNVIGMYDTPATTLNFETFKSYLLKNSGFVGNDVKVTYLTDNGSEWIIDSQEGFEIALCAFRLKARLGEVIFLKLDKIRGSNHQLIRKHSNDVQTQSDNNDSIASNIGAPPEWFLIYMKQFKRDLVDEVTYAVSANLAATSKEKEVTPSVAVVTSKKAKPESSKRCRKHMMLGETPIDKELLKTLKFDRKLEIKLDKLDAKTKKIKEKKQALIKTIDLDEARYVTKHSQIPTDVDGRPLMNASLVSESAVVPHMMGGETYLHTWEVINNGKLPWTSKTELRLTWGSAEMKPASNVIRCPPLQPNEKGTICMRFQIPKKPGQYESYWNFFDRDMRFGQWLSCCVIVDVPISYLSENILPKKPKIDEEHQQNVFPEKPKPLSPKANTPDKGDELKQYLTKESFIILKDTSFEPQLEGAAGLSNNVIDLSRRIQDIKIVGSPQVDSDSDWESLWSYGGTRKVKNMDEKNLVTDSEQPASNKYGIHEKDLIVDLSKTNKEVKSDDPAPSENNVENVEKEAEAEKPHEENSNSNDDNNNNGNSVNNNSSTESICEIASEASSDLSSGYDVISAPLCEEREEGSGYVYITIDGNKLPVPKYILRPDFLANAEEAPGPLNSEDEEKTMMANAPKKENAPADEQSAINAAKLEAEVLGLEQNLEETKTLMSQMSAAVSKFTEYSGSTPTRLFIFPQNNPGFEVVYPKNEEENGEKPTTFQNSVTLDDPNQTYSWAQSQTQYTLADLQNLTCDPYGPLEQSRPASSQSFMRVHHAPPLQHIPNYQQTMPKFSPTRNGSSQGNQNNVENQERKPSAPPQSEEQPQQHRTPNSPVQNMPPVHILPENLVSGAVNVASSAINTARSVINMIVPPRNDPGKWVNGHWVTDNPESLRAKNLCILADMGFWDTDLNATLLARYNDDISRVVSELVQ